MKNVLFMKIARVNVESGPGLRAAPKGDQPLRIAMVYREAFLLTYVWHLTAFFERVCPTGLLVWEYWSYADLAQSTRMAVATKAIRVLDWVVFCQATPEALPSHVQRWAESWPSPEREAQPLVGFFSLTGDDLGSEGKAQAWVRKMARKANRGFVAVRDCLSGARRSVRTSHLQPTRLIYE
jgi:hypothetical protein